MNGWRLRHVFRTAWCLGIGLVILAPNACSSSRPYSACRQSIKDVCTPPVGEGCQNWQTLGAQQCCRGGSTIPGNDHCSTYKFLEVGSDTYYYDPATSEVVAFTFEDQCFAGPSDFELPPCSSQSVSCSDFDLSICHPRDAGTADAGTVEVGTAEAGGDP
jgi:hypothetical protein